LALLLQVRSLSSYSVSIIEALKMIINE